MTPRELVIKQIGHQETRPVPYTLHMSESVADAMNGHCGGELWRDRRQTHATMDT